MDAKVARKPRLGPERSPDRAAGRVVVEGLVIELLASGRARLEIAGGRVVECRCAHGIDLGWLRAALAVGPLEAEATLGERGGSLWAVFPGPEHAEVLSETVVVSAAKAIELRCGRSTVNLKADGRIRVRGCDVATRGSRVARLQGHTIRLN